MFEQIVNKFQMFLLLLLLALNHSHQVNSQQNLLNQILPNGYDPQIKPQTTDKNDVLDVSIAAYMNELLGIKEGQVCSMFYYNNF